MRSLNSRLVAGLLAVTAVGLTLMGGVSAVVLRGYLLHRVNNQLEAVRRRGPPTPWPRAATSSSP
ncbi:hypothetical protein NE236_40325 [Actinoallomurus purpureus]|uniref:hypothetical protein n=1 Tax=Actinoallomurus purpureus TaxID=478114 RepID=UPI002092EC13|nr:hypothetical protein [Actinoallomurus purpureus]MCO6011215.1 hypothetical protein [Actinoallomurus purpureus]